MDHRKRILKIYNKGPKDFTTLAMFDQYQEEVEELIFCLTNGQPVPVFALIGDPNLESARPSENQIAVRSAVIQEEKKQLRLKIREENLKLSKRDVEDEEDQELMQLEAPVATGASVGNATIFSASGANLIYCLEKPKVLMQRKKEHVKVQEVKQASAFNAQWGRERVQAELLRGFL